jgi:hypothetical protein
LEDIQPQLFQISAAAAPAVALSDYEANTLTRLIIRCLQGLGLTLPVCEASHSSQNQRLCDFTSNALDFIDLVGCSSGLSVCGRSTKGEALLHYLLPSEASTEILREGEGRYGKSTRMLADMKAVTTAQRLSELWDMPIVAGANLLRQHINCSQLGCDSQLNFILQLLINVSDTLEVALSQTLPSSLTKAASQVLDFVSQLRCGAIALITQRFLVEVNSLCSADAMDRSRTSSEVSEIRADMLIRFREQTRSLLQRRIVDHSSTSHTLAQEERGHRDHGRNDDDNDDDLRLWCAYVQAEAAVGETDEAIKVSSIIRRNNIASFSAILFTFSFGCMQCYSQVTDKLLKNIAQQYRSSPSTKSETELTNVVNKSGALQLFWIAVKLVLQLGSNSSASAAGNNEQFFLSQSQPTLSSSSSM